MSYFFSTACRSIVLIATCTALPYLLFALSTSYINAPFLMHTGVGTLAHVTFQLSIIVFIMVGTIVNTPGCDFIIKWW